MAAALPTAVVPERPGAPEPPAPHGHGNATPQLSHRERPDRCM